MKKGLTIACCGDSRLNAIVSLLNGNRCYQKRDLGTPFDFIINQGEFLVWHSKLTGFPESTAPISDALVLLHMDCLAVHGNAFFASLRDKRCERYAMTPEGDLEFCLKQLDKIQGQAKRLKGSIPIHWHFGIIDTAMAEQLDMDSAIKDALDCIKWPYGMPKFFAEQAHREQSDTLYTRYKHSVSRDHNAHCLAHAALAEHPS